VTGVETRRYEASRDEAAAEERAECLRLVEARLREGADGQAAADCGDERCEGKVVGSVGSSERSEASVEKRVSLE
jgi:hypothetical protein